MISTACGKTATLTGSCTGGLLVRAFASAAGTRNAGRLGVPQPVGIRPLAKTGVNNTSVKQGPGGRHSTSGHIVTVFGATGFLGRYLVQELARRGSQVVVPYRGSEEDTRHLRVLGDLGQVVPLRVDVREPESILECVRNSDAVYNLIGKRWETRNFSLYDTHVETARGLARVSKEAGVQRFIHVSHNGADTQSSSKILKAKGLGELAVELEFPEAIVVRPSVMFGNEDRLLQNLGRAYTHPIKKFFTLGFIPTINGGNQVMSPIYVNDVARGLFQLLEAEDPLPLYEFTGPQKMTYRDVVEMFCEYARKPFTPISLPHSVFRSMVSIAEYNPLHRTNVNDVDVAALDEVYNSQVGTLADLGVEPRKLEELIIRFVRHFRSNEWADQPASLDEVKFQKTYRK